MYVAFWKFSNNPPSSDSVADSMMFIIILNSTGTSPFPGGIYVICVLDFGPREEYPPDMMCASCPEISDASEYICRIIPLLLYSVTESGCDML